MDRKKRISINIDVVRVILAFLVVAIHSLQVESSINFYIVNGVARIAVPLFFILTGINLDIEKLKDRTYIKKYIKKQVEIFLPWIVIYVFVAIYSFVNSNNILYGGSLFIQFWFVSATWVAVILLHILLKRFDLKKVLIVSLVLHIFGILGDGYLSITQRIPVMSTIYSIFLISFIKTRSGLFFGLFYICLGMYFNEKKIWLKLSNKVTAVLIVITLVLQCIEINILLMTQTKHYNMYFSLIPLTLLIMCFIKNNESTKKSKIDYKRMSVQIYITHTLIIFMVASYYDSFFTSKVFLPVIISYMLIFMILMLFQYIVKQTKIESIFTNYRTRVGKKLYIVMLIIGICILVYSLLILPRSSNLSAECLVIGIASITISTSYLINFKEAYKKYIYQAALCIGILAVIIAVDLIGLAYFQMTPMLITKDMILALSGFLP